jgi:methyl-accepting chemotaxis protein
MNPVLTQLVGAGVDIDDLDTQVWAFAERSLIVAGLVVLLMLAVSMLVGRSITAPLQHMTAVMKTLAGGKLDVEVPGIGRRDEVGEMAGAVEVFKSNAVAREKLQISSIQVATQEAVGAIREISGTIERLSEISSTIAAAVEEQGAATQEISRNVQQAARGAEQVSANITDVQRGASDTGSASSQVFSAAKSLSGDSNRLKFEVGKFLNSVRAA